MGIWIVVMLGLVSSVGLICYFEFKKKELDYKKANDEQTKEISVKALKLEIEKEHTKQMQLDSDAFKTKENTKQYEIKAEYKEKYGSTLF